MSNENKIGIIRAATHNPKYFASERIISHLEIHATGLLQTVVQAVIELETAAVVYGDDDEEKNYTALRHARVRIFRALKEIEIAGAQLETKATAGAK